MGTGIGATLLSGLGLGGVLAVAAAWSIRAGTRHLPHPAVGALAGVAALLGFRLLALPRPVGLIAVMAACGCLAAGLAVAERRLLPDHPPWIGHVAVLTLIIVVAGLLQPRGAVPLPFGPLGARAGSLASSAALLLGVGGALIVGGWPRRASRRLAWPRPITRSRHADPLAWAGVGALLACVAVLAAGVLGSDPTRALGVIALPDTAGLAARGFAVALLARDGPTAAVLGVTLGVSEALLGLVDPFGGLSLLPLVLVGAGGLALRVRRLAAEGSPA